MTENIPSGSVPPRSSRRTPSTAVLTNIANTGRQDEVVSEKAQDEEEETRSSSDEEEETWSSNEVSLGS